MQPGFGFHISTEDVNHWYYTENPNEPKDVVYGAITYQKLSVTELEQLPSFEIAQQGNIIFSSTEHGDCVSLLRAF